MASDIRDHYPQTKKKKLDLKQFHIPVAPKRRRMETNTAKAVNSKPPLSLALLPQEEDESQFPLCTQTEVVWQKPLPPSSSSRAKIPKKLVSASTQSVPQRLPTRRSHHDSENSSLSDVEGICLFFNSRRHLVSAKPKCDSPDRKFLKSSVLASQKNYASPPRPKAKSKMEIAIEELDKIRPLISRSVSSPEFPSPESKIKRSIHQRRTVSAPSIISQPSPEIPKAPPGSLQNPLECLVEETSSESDTDSGDDSSDGSDPGDGSESVINSVDATDETKLEDSRAPPPPSRGRPAVYPVRPPSTLKEKYVTRNLERNPRRGTSLEDKTNKRRRLDMEQNQPAKLRSTASRLPVAASSTTISSSKSTRPPKPLHTQPQSRLKYKSSKKSQHLSSKTRSKSSRRNKIPLTASQAIRIPRKKLTDEKMINYGNVRVNSSRSETQKPVRKQINYGDPTRCTQPSQVFRNKRNNGQENALQQDAKHKPIPDMKPTTNMKPTANFKPTAQTESKQTPQINDESQSQQNRRDFRPTPPVMIEEYHSFTFQVFDIDHSTCGAQKSLEMRLFGLTSRGNSILVHVHNFYPYFFVEVPSGWDKREIQCFIEFLKSSLRKRQFGAQNDKIKSWEIKRKKTLMGYSSKPKSFLKIVVTSPQTIRSLTYMLSNCGSIPNIPVGAKLRLFESNVDVILRFGVDYNIGGATWVKVPKNEYKHRLGAKHESHCQIEVDVNCSSLQSLPSTGEYSRIAPLLIASVDIECIGTENKFPIASNPTDSIIQIATSLQREGEADICYRHVLSYKPCLPIENTEVQNVGSERELLIEWQKFIVEVDPDVLVGYNIFGFDLPYIWDRMKMYSIQVRLGRIKDEPSRIKERSFSSKQQGSSISRQIIMSGRIQMDLYKLIQISHKLPSYSLNAVSAHFLKQQKDDVDYRSIAPLFHGDIAGRTRLARYCVKDTILPLRLISHLKILINLVEMGRVTGVLVNSLVLRGQQYKVFSQICRETKKCGYLIPTYQFDRNANGKSDGKQGGASNGAGYQGATVIEAKKGCYMSPIATLDFKSLYPSIMIAYNLSYETLLRNKRDAQRFDPKDVFVLNEGKQNEVRFLKCSATVATEGGREGGEVGFLPRILQNLLDARAKAKQEMKNTTDPVAKSILNGKQLALKISANSIYGFCGATKGFLPCIAIAAAVTSIGRNLIDKTKEITEAHFTHANGYPGNASVIYGDTDSVMVKFNTGIPADNGLNRSHLSSEQKKQLVEEEIKLAMKFGEKAAALITAQFPEAIELEYEKVYRPYLLFSKKRYAGLLYSNCYSKHDYMDVKGLSTVRRDSCKLVQETLNECLDIILKNNDILRAQQCVQLKISQLLSRQIPIHKLIISKTWSKAVYKTKVPHLRVHQKILARNPGSAPKYQLGDRIQYVITETGKKQSVANRAEDPLYVMQKGIPVDVHWYIKHQLKNPISSLFELVMPNPEELFSGDHMLSKSLKFNAANDMMASYVRIEGRCLGCNCTVLQNQPLCSECETMKTAFRQQKQNAFNEFKRRREVTWKKCEECVRAMNGRSSSSKPAGSTTSSTISSNSSAHNGETSKGGINLVSSVMANSDSLNVEASQILTKTGNSESSYQASQRDSKFAALCRNTDCGNFFLRDLADQNLKCARQQLSRFAF